MKSIKSKIQVSMLSVVLGGAGRLHINWNHYSYFERHRN